MVNQRRVKTLAKPTSTDHVGSNYDFTKFISYSGSLGSAATSGPIAVVEQDPGNINPSEKRKKSG